jgi:hypothetical protein
MVICYLHVVSVSNFPTKTDSPLVIDSNRILAFAVAREFLKAITGRDSQIVDAYGSINHREFSLRRSISISRKTYGPLSIKNRLGDFPAKAFYHASIITPCVNSIKHYYQESLVPAFKRR